MPRCPHGAGQLHGNVPLHPRGARLRLLLPLLPGDAAHHRVRDQADHHRVPHRHDHRVSSGEVEKVKEKKCDRTRRVIPKSDRKSIFLMDPFIVECFKMQSSIIMCCQALSSRWCITSALSNLITIMK